MSIASTSTGSVRVIFSQVEDVRRVVLAGLAVHAAEHLSEAKQAKLAGRIAADLRDAGLLGKSIEQHYRAVDVAALLSRTPRWVSESVQGGLFGPCAKDDGGWLIPATGVQRYLDAHVFLAEPKVVHLNEVSA